MSYHSLGLDVSAETSGKVEATGTSVYTECHTKVEQYGQTRDTFKGCLSASASAAAAVICGAYASPEIAPICQSVAGQVVGKLAGALYDLGDALGLTGDKEWAEKQAADAAAWNAWTIAFQTLLQARLTATAKLDAAITAALKAEADAKLTARSNVASVTGFFSQHGVDLYWNTSLNKFTPKAYDSAFCAASGGCYGTDAGKVVAYAWKTAANVALKQYAVWFYNLNQALQAWFASVTVRAVTEQLRRTQIAKAQQVAAAKTQAEARSAMALGFVVTSALAAGGYWYYRRRKS